MKMNELELYSATWITHTILYNRPDTKFHLLYDYIDINLKNSVRSEDSCDL